MCEITRDMLMLINALRLENSNIYELSYPSYDVINTIDSDVEPQMCQ